MEDIVLFPLIVSFVLAYSLTPVGIWFAKRYRFIDDPKTHRHPAVIHKRPIPRAGGLSIFLAILFSSFFFLPFNNVFFSIFLAGFVMVVVGLLDDKFDLSPYFRFCINIVCAAIVVANGVSLPFITNPFGGILHFSSISLELFHRSFILPIGSILAVIWITWVMNMLNWSKGVDGQMPGVAAISSIIIGIASLRFETLDPMNVLSAKMSFIVAGAALGFLPFNFYPAKIFPGYSATILGFIIGILSILSSVKLATAVLVMGVPMTDACITIVRRLLTKRSPFWHDKGHLHHLLLNFGLSHRVIAIMYWVISILLGLLALNLSSKGKLFAIMVVIVIVSGIIVYLKFLVRKHAQNY